METTVNQRIEVIRQNIGLNQREFAQLLDIDEATYSKYKKGTLIPGSTVLDKIVKNVKNISIEWLFYGKIDNNEELKVEEPSNTNYNNPTKNLIFMEEHVMLLSATVRQLTQRVEELEQKFRSIENPSKKKTNAG